MGPYYLTAIVSLLGPVARVAGFASTRTRERTIEIGPRAGERFAAATPTHATAAMELESGVTANLVASFETTGQYVCDLEIHGTEGVLSFPDPNGFEGPVRMRRGREGWQEVPFAARGDRDARGLGLHELVEAIAADRPERASGSLGLHVVDVARGILTAAAESRIVEISSRASQPEAMPVETIA
jgi:predicted dehydrogenase